MPRTPSLPEHLKRARTGLILDQPFFATLLLHLDMVDDTNQPTMQTDGKEIRYNPAWTAGLPIDQLKGVLCHETMHAALCHTTRRAGRDPKTWNMAGDLAINPLLRAAGLALPPEALDDPQYHGQETERIYAALAGRQYHGQETERIYAALAGRPKPEPEPGDDDQDGKPGDQQQPGDGPGDGDGDGDGQGDGQGDQDGDGNGDGNGQGKGQGKGEPTTYPGDCGSCTDAPPDASPRELDGDWKQRITQAKAVAKAYGKLPAALDEALNGLLNPRIDWRETLRRYITNTLHGDNSWNRPDRRFIARGVYLPSPRSEEISIAVAVDTSGSVSAEELQQFAGEISDILCQYRITATILYCDAAVHRADHITPADLPWTPPETYTGRGGTDFAPPFTWLDEHGETPRVLVYLTDMECSSYAPEPAYPVLWVSTQDPREYYRPPYGEVTVID